MPRAAALPQGMRLRYPPPAVPATVDAADRETRLWKTCAHEAGHYVVASHFNWVVRWPRVFNEFSAVVHDKRPHGYENASPDAAVVFGQQDAMISAAGVVVSEMFEWWTPGTSYDMDYVRAVLRWLDHPSFTVPYIKRRAEVILGQQWHNVLEVADYVYCENIDKQTPGNAPRRV